MKKSIQHIKPFLNSFLFMPFQFLSKKVNKEEDLIRKARQDSNKAFSKQDVEGISKFWLDDFVVIRGSGVIEYGKEANKMEWKRIFKETPQIFFERFPKEIIVSKNYSDLAWETGKWKGFNTYSKGGRYSAQWKKKDGEWKLQAELFVAIDV